MNRLCSTAANWLLAIALLISLPAFSLAQDFGGGDTGGNTGGNTGGGGGFNLPTGQPEFFEGLELPGFSLAPEIEVEPSLRFEPGFVGVLSADTQGEGLNARSIGFIGQRGESEGIDFGGGINDSATLGSTTNANNVGQGGGGFVGAGGTSLYFEVPRKGIRARLAPPQFRTRANIVPEELTYQFVNRLSRTPATRELSNQYRINVVDKTAIITGYVRSEAAKRKIERQLRLEPGIYRIDNRLQIVQ